MAQRREGDSAPPLQERITGVVLTDGREYSAPRVVICPGTFTRAVCHLGERTHRAGRWGERSADALGSALEALGLPLRRLKNRHQPAHPSRLGRLYGALAAVLRMAQRRLFATMRRACCRRGSCPAG